MIFFVGKMANCVHMERKGKTNMPDLSAGFNEK